MIIMGTLCLLLDGVDGRVARARGEASAFRSQIRRRDRRGDAGGAERCGCCTRDRRLVGAGDRALRYGYVATSLVVPALRTPLPYRYSGKVIAVAQAVALLAALTFGLTHGEHWVPTTFLLAALALLCWSFGRYVIWQLRHPS